MTTEVVTHPCPGCGEPVSHEVPTNTSGLMGAIRALGISSRCDACIDAHLSDSAASNEALERKALESRIAASGLPAGLRALSWGDMLRDTGRGEVVDAVKSWTVKGGSLFLFGRPGPGKTRLAATAAWSVLQARQLRYVQAAVLFTKANADFGSDWRREAEELLLGRHPLVLDDLGKENPSALTRQLLQAALDERIASGVHLLITSNLTAPELGAVYGDWLASRLGQMEQWHMPGPDMRLEM